MSFRSVQEAEQRLQNPQPLAEQEVIDLMQWMHMLGEGSRLRLQAHLGIGNVRAIQALNETSAKIEGAVRRMDEGSTRLNVALLALTVIGILLAAFAAWVADKSYKDANTSSIKQQQTLDASRRSLESATQALNQLTGVATKESQSLDRQLTIAETKEKRELDRLSRKPEIEITAFSYCPLNPEIRNPVMVFKSARSWLNRQSDIPRICGGPNLDIEVQNSGNSVAHRLVLRCERKTIPSLKTAGERGISSPEVTPNLRPVGLPNPRVRATEDYIVLGPLDLRPISQERHTEAVVLEANVPSTVGSYHVFCEGDEEIIGFYKFSFVVAKDSVRPQP